MASSIHVRRCFGRLEGGIIQRFSSGTFIPAKQLANAINSCVVKSLKLSVITISERTMHGTSRMFVAYIPFLVTICVVSDVIS